jgi:hypothetical protein
MTIASWQLMPIFGPQRLALKRVDLWPLRRFRPPAHALLHPLLTNMGLGYLTDAQTMLGATKISWANAHQKQKLNLHVNPAGPPLGDTSSLASVNAYVGAYPNEDTWYDPTHDHPNSDHAYPLASGVGSHGNSCRSVGRQGNGLGPSGNNGTGYPLSHGHHQHGGAPPSNHMQHCWPHDRHPHGMPSPCASPRDEDRVTDLSYHWNATVILDDFPLNEAFLDDVGFTVMDM